MKEIKNTNYKINPIIVIVFLIVSLASCKPSVKVSSSYQSKPTSKTSKEESSSENSKVKKVIATARSYKGTKYKFGGCSRSGIDCSGLTTTAFKSVNIQLPRTSQEQSQKYKSVPLSELKPGDLVFFSEKKGSKKVTHVGIITEVKSSKEIHFIHASTKAGVIEENLNASWYLPLFLKGGRVF